MGEALRDCFLDRNTHSDEQGKEKVVMAQPLKHSYKEALRVEQPPVSRFGYVDTLGQSGVSSRQETDRGVRPVQWQSGGSKGGLAKGENMNILLEAKTQLADLQNKIEWLIRKEMASNNMGSGAEFVGVEPQIGGHEPRFPKLFDNGQWGFQFGQVVLGHSGSGPSKPVSEANNSWRIRLESDPRSISNGNSTCVPRPPSEAARFTVGPSLVAQTASAMVVEQILHSRELEKLMQPVNFFPDGLVSKQNLSIETLDFISTQFEQCREVDSAEGLSQRSTEPSEKVLEGGAVRSVELGEDSVVGISQSLTETSADIVLVPETQVSIFPPENEVVNMVNEVEWEGRNLFGGEGETGIREPLPLTC
ncbi:hypothetical protein F2P56_015591 [Juglans regia]|uniref:Uncharacterized protein n=1 Tax=Juglans regia TaxID=51240 RepID=A0A834CVM1_JUGRE|nr:hypothetical protein F2P56_015591 [Juglans regia]